MKKLIEIIKLKKDYYVEKLPYMPSGVLIW